MDSQVNLVQSTWQVKEDYAVFIILTDRIYEFDRGLTLVSTAWKLTKYN